jgi:hypothetical protein
MGKTALFCGFQLKMFIENTYSFLFIYLFSSRGNCEKLNENELNEKEKKVEIFFFFIY